VHQVTFFGAQQNVQFSRSCLYGQYWSAILTDRIGKGKRAKVKYGIPYTFHGGKLIFGKTKRAIKAIQDENNYRPIEVEAGHKMDANYYGDVIKTKNGKVYINMLLAECDLFQQVVKNYGNWQGTHSSLVDRVKVLLQIVQDLRFLHRLGYIHRDLKLENVLCFPGGKYKLTDFEFVKKIGCKKDDLDKGGCGTLMYIAPEIVKGIKSKQGVQSTVFSDIFALGIIGAELVCKGKLKGQWGQPVYNNNTQTGRKEINSIIDAKNPHAKKKYIVLIRKMTGSKPKKRPSLKKTEEKLENIIKLECSNSCKVKIK